MPKYCLCYHVSYRQAYLNLRLLLLVLQNQRDVLASTREKLLFSVAIDTVNSPLSDLTWGTTNWLLTGSGRLREKSSK